MSTSILFVDPPAPHTAPKSTEITTHDVRPHNAYRMKMRGMQVSAIAKAFGVCERTIHRWFAQHVDEFRESLESQPAANLIARQLAELEEMQQHALTEAANCGSKRDKVAFLKTALSAKSQIIDLMLSTGVIPKTPEKLYTVMIDEKRVTGSAGEETVRSTDEIKENIIKLLKNCRSIV